MWILRFAASPSFDLLSELNKQLETKQDELFSKKADLKKIPGINQAKSEPVSFADQDAFRASVSSTFPPLPVSVLEIVDLYSQLWTLQKKPANETSIDQVQGEFVLQPGVAFSSLNLSVLLPALQNRLDGLIGDIKGNDNLKSSRSQTFRRRL